MTQSIVIQVGQCGNQIGCRFWDLCLREHSFYNKKGNYDHSISSFFRNTDIHGENIAVDVPFVKGLSKIKNLKARAILIDMEEGVVNELLTGYLRDVFDSKNLISDVSGSGNNWAVGNLEYGQRYREEISESIRRAAEQCDCLQCFFILHSMGGGTGSGLGTFVLSLLKEEFPDVYRFVCSVYPSKDDDVITSPYNSMLAMHQLTKHADCVLPINNQSLLSMCERIYNVENKRTTFKGSTNISVSSGAGTIGEADKKPFDHMNNIVANLILNMTSSSRFEGSLNVDLNEFAMNLVPFPKLHYLVSSMAPLYISKDLGLPPRRLNHAFDELFAKGHQLMDADMRRGVYLASALVARGKDVQMSDIRNNITRLKDSLEFVRWNQEGWKTGLCNYPPVGQPYSLLALSNNTSIKHSFMSLRSHFNKLYTRKAHVHHYEKVDGFDVSMFDESLNSLDSLVKEYDDLEIMSRSQEFSVPMMKVL